MRGVYRAPPTSGGIAKLARVHACFLAVGIHCPGIHLPEMCHAFLDIGREVPDVPFIEFQPATDDVCHLELNEWDLVIGEAGWQQRRWWRCGRRWRRR